MRKAFTANARQAEDLLAFAKEKEYSLPKLYGPGICPFHLKYKNC